MSDHSKPSRICAGQSVEQGKYEVAKALRRNMTLAERKLWERLRASQLDGYHFRRQQIIKGFIADFYCHSAALVVEVDGDIHDKIYDTERDRVFEDKGILTLRFSNEQVLNHMDEVLDEILVRLKQREPNPLHPLP